MSSKPSAPAPTRRPPRAETRRRVLDAAIEVFGARGIAGTSVSDVAAAAGLTKGAVYSNFAGKDELVLAIMEEHALERLGAALAGFDIADDPAEAIANVGRVLVEALRSDAVWHRLLAEFFALSHRDPATRDALQQRRREARGAVARALTRVSTMVGVALPLPAEDLAVVLFALSNGLGMESGIDPDSVGDDLAARVLGLLFRDFVETLSAQR